MNVQPPSSAAGAGSKTAICSGEPRAEFDLFITSDQNIHYQQKLAGRQVAILELSTNDLRRIQAAAALIQSAIQTIQPLEFRRLEIHLKFMLKTFSSRSSRGIWPRSNRRLSAHRAVDDDGKLLSAVAERGHHPARGASGVVGRRPEPFSLHFSGWPAQIGIVIAGAFGSWLGATVMFWFARIAGRPLILRYGRLVLFPPRNWRRLNAGCRTMARWVCLSRDCCRVRVNWLAFPPASRGWIT